jgi:micrococcal nuclease
MYEYRAVVLRVVDGDTVHLDVDLGFDVKRRDSFRFYGINAPEISTAAGKTAKAWLEKRLPVGAVVSVRTQKDKREKYGRYLGTIFLDDVNINEQLVTEGHAQRYMV